jgi:hypothetical protein
LRRGAEDSNSSSPSLVRGLPNSFRSTLTSGSVDDHERAEADGGAGSAVLLTC